MKTCVHKLSLALGLVGVALVGTADASSLKAGLWGGTVTNPSSSNINKTDFPANPTVYVSPHVAASTAKPPWADGATWVYWGQMYFNGGTYHFAESIDDAVYLKIDDTVWLDDTRWDVMTKSGDVMLSAGWHTFELRLGNGSGGAGARAGSGWTATKGFGYNVDGKDTTNGGDYTFPEDSGAMDLFRCGEMIPLTVAGPSVIADQMSPKAGKTSVMVETEATLTAPAAARSTADHMFFTCTGWELVKADATRLTGTGNQATLTVTDDMAGATFNWLYATTPMDPETYTRRVVATAAEKTGVWANAAVAGEDATAVIQGQLDACVEGEIVVLKPACYVLTNYLRLATAGVTLKSDDGTGRLARKTTLLYRPETSTNRLVKITAQRTTVWGLTLTNGFVNASQGGGAYLDNCGAASGLRCCDVVGCTSWAEKWTGTTVVGDMEGAGGGVYIYKSGVVSNCLIRANTGFTGGGVCMEGDQRSWAELSTIPRVTDCELCENVLIGIGHYNERGCGSAVYGYRTACLDGCTVTSNICNAAASRNRTVAGWQGCLMVSNCYFNANNGGKTDGWAEIGQQGGVRVTGCTFYREPRQLVTGCDEFSRSQMIECSSYAGASSFKSCLFLRNTKSACLGGSGACSTVENCTFIGNWRCVYSTGAGSAALASRTNRVINCIFRGNTEDLFGDNDVNALPNAFFVSNCCIRTKSFDLKGGRKFGLLDGTNTCYTFDEKLLEEYEAKVIKFIDAANGDYRLQRKSLLRDAGVKRDWMTGATDLDGNPRCLNRNGRRSDDALPDVGCYECAIRTPGCMIVIR